MRVIGGSAKGLRLKKVPGCTTRPIMDRVKENLFNILAGWIADSTWLDLFAGTGQVGIEALSRGASSTVFVDNETRAIKVIHENLARTKFKDRGTVVHMDAFKYIKNNEDRCFDVIYIAPPQYKELWIRAVMKIDRAPGMIGDENGMIIVQIDPQEYEELELANFVLFDKRRYGRTMLCFYELV
jgi:16S rRNA (guanine(966)-N(2))-methyltransferase RsmD